MNFFLKLEKHCRHVLKHYKQIQQHIINRIELFAIAILVDFLTISIAKKLSRCIVVDNIFIIGQNISDKLLSFGEEGLDIIFGFWEAQNS